MSAPDKPVIIETMTEADEVPHRAPYFIDLGENGRFKVYHGMAVVVGTEQHNNRPHAVSLAIAMSGCKCGCGAPGRMIEFMPDPDHARLLAQQLIEAADAVSEAARRDAAAALRKAAGR